jgi:hypothetical protein
MLTGLGSLAGFNGHRPVCAQWFLQTSTTIMAGQATNDGLYGLNVASAWDLDGTDT